jgi:drug/metabolite transporter (DMT)-like permease
LVASVPILAVLLSRFTIAHERLGPKRALGLAVGALRVAALVGVDLQASSALGVAEMLAVCVGYAVGPVIIATKLSELPGPGVVGTSVVLLALIPTLAGFLVFFALILEAGPVRATVVTYVNPAVALFLGVVLLGEPITTGLAIGFPMIIIGSILATGRSPLIEPVAP